MSEWYRFLEEVKSAEHEIGANGQVWYRGQSQESWDLIPSLLRLTEWEKNEKLLFEEFKYMQTSINELQKRGNDWDTLFDMQHYGIPTRLLDLTTVMGVAIAFILYADYEDSTDSALYILNPIALNRLSKRDEIIGASTDRDFEYQKIYWENKPAQVEKPIAIKPQLPSDRVLAQKGVFTVHGTLSSGFEQCATDAYRKVILKDEAKEEARNFLKWANLDEYTIYPDIVGMAQHIKRKILKGV